MIIVDINGSTFSVLNQKYFQFLKLMGHVETQFSTYIKILQSNSRGEYMSREFHDFLNQKGIVSQQSCPYTTQQNGMAK